MSFESEIDQLLEAVRRDHAIGETSNEHRLADLHQGNWAGSFTFATILEALASSDVEITVLMASGAVHRGLISEILVDATVLSRRGIYGELDHIACSHPQISQVSTSALALSSLKAPARVTSRPRRSILSLAEELISAERLAKLRLVGARSEAMHEVLSVGENFIATKNASGAKTSSVTFVPLASIETLHYSR